MVLFQLMGNRIMKKALLIMSFVVAAVIFWGIKDAKSAKFYTARWEYVCTRYEVITNALGDVIQPHKSYEGTYEDARRTDANELEWMIKNGFLDKAREQFASDYDRAGFALSDVTNAFNSVSYEISGDEIAVVDIFVKANSPALALAVLGCWHDCFCRMIDAEGKERLDKVRRWYSLKGESCEDVLNSAAKHNRRVYTLRGPEILQ